MSNAFRQDAGPEVWKSLCADYELLSIDYTVRIPMGKAEQSDIVPDQVNIKEKYGDDEPAQ